MRCWRGCISTDAYGAGGSIGTSCHPLAIWEPAKAARPVILIIPMTREELRGAGESLLLKAARAMAAFSAGELRQHLPRTLVHASAHLEHARTELPRIPLEQFAQPLVHAPAKARALDGDVAHPVRLLERDVDDQVEAGDGLAHARDPPIEIPGDVARAGEEVGEEVDRGAVEDAVAGGGFDRREGAGELELEVVGGGWVGEVMALGLEEVPGLVDDGVIGEEAGEALGEGGLAGGVGAGEGEKHGGAELP